MNNIESLNSLALAYLGDSIYEKYIREYLLKIGIVKVNELQKEAIKYVSAKKQSEYLIKMIDNNFLSEEELTVVKRARNHKSHASKSTDIRKDKNSLLNSLLFSNTKSLKFISLFLVIFFTGYIVINTLFQIFSNSSNDKYFK